MDMDALYRLYFRDVFLFLQGLTHSESLAEELTQETFFKTLNGLKRFDGRQDIRAWLFTVARNCYYSHCRKANQTVPLNEIKNAGSIFLGRNVPEALGDYFAGPNHTLPTSGTARFSSPLGVDDFVKKSSFLYYTRDALEAVAPRIADFAEREGLHAHARSVTIRYE